MINKITKPPLIIIIFIVGLTHLSETVYSPSLPEIAMALNTIEPNVEYTLTIYLFGFSFGSLFWGNLSDKVGRKPCVILGLLIFALGCFFCYLSKSIEHLMISRLIQSFGGGVASVIGQSICRDAFHGKDLGRTYSSIGAALAVFPAIGPIIGGFITEYFEWNNIFLFLIFFSSFMIFFSFLYLPETHPKEYRKPTNIKKVLIRLIKDKKVISFAFIIAGCNGIYFSYFSEGSFYLIKRLSLSPSEYGIRFFFVAMGGLFGGIISRKLHKYFDSKEIMGFGILITVLSTFLFTISAYLYTYFFDFEKYTMAIIAISFQSLILCGSSMITSNALSLALVDHKDCVGTASSLFGFFYYLLISLVTFVMGLIHMESLILMPFYFFTISLFMLFIYKKILLRLYK